MHKLTAIITSIALTILTNPSCSQNFEWVQQYGGALGPYGGAFGESRSVAIDDFGNVYTTGYFNGTVDFDPGPNTFNLSSNSESNDIFITKLDNTGNLIWAKKIGGPLEDHGFAIALDVSGNIYTTGSFGETVDFNPGNETFNLTALSGARDVFINKLDAEGNFVWAKQFKGNAGCYGFSLVVDALGNIYTAGYLQFTADFDPGPNSFFLSATGIGGDIFVSKLDASGNFLWAKQMGGSSSIVPSIDQAFSLAVDGSGNVYTTGIFEYTADFDPGPGVFNLTSTGGYDAFISKLSSNGNFIWAKQLGGSLSEYGRAIITSADGTTYVTGHFEGVVDFDPSPSILNLTSAGGNDIFTIKLNDSGDLVWAKQQGGTDHDYAFAMSLDPFFNLYTTGYFYGTSDFDPGIGIYNLSSVGSADLFISKLNQSGNLIWANKTGGIHNEFGYSMDVNKWGKINVVGPFAGIADFDPGSGTHILTAIGIVDMFSLSLTQCTNSSSTHTIAACDSYTWIDGNTYTASNNTATLSLPSKAGCDSLVYINLTINKSTSSTDVITACNSYTWIDGNTYTSSNNTATLSFTNKTGCDSLVTLNLTVNIVDNGIAATSNTLTANAIGANYKWFNCDNNEYIDDANDQSFVPPVSGSYGVEILLNGCKSTSNCLLMITDFQVYPNPTAGNITLLIPDNLKVSELQLYNILGQTLLQKRINESQIIELNIEGISGIYLVVLKTIDGKSILVKVLKK